MLGQGSLAYGLCDATLNTSGNANPEDSKKSAIEDAYPVVEFVALSVIAERLLFRRDALIRRGRPVITDRRPILIEP